MATIINNTDMVLSPASQQAVRNAAASYGTDKVEVVRAAWGGADGKLWDIYDREQEDSYDGSPVYIGTLDTIGDVISNMR